MHLHWEAGNAAGARTGLDILLAAAAACAGQDTENASRFAATSPTSTTPVDDYPSTPAAPVAVYGTQPDGRWAPGASLAGGWGLLTPSESTASPSGTASNRWEVELPAPNASTRKPCRGREVKGAWRPEEDMLLCALVQKMGARKWSLIAEHIPGRTGKQARERWLNQLSPKICKRPWTADEDRLIVSAHDRMGNKWSEIARLLEGRTDNAVKNRYNSFIRKTQTSCRARSASTEPAAVLPRELPPSSATAEAHSAPSVGGGEAVATSEPDTFDSAHSGGELHSETSVGAETADDR